MRQSYMQAQNAIQQLLSELARARGTRSNGASAGGASAGGATQAAAGGLSREGSLEVKQVRLGNGSMD